MGEVEYEKAGKTKVGKSGMIKERVDKERRIRRIGISLEKSGAEAKGGTEDKKGGTIVSTIKSRDTDRKSVV